MGERSIPPFDHTIKWKRKEDRGERRSPNYRNRIDGSGDEAPASGQDVTMRPAMIRQRSLQQDTEAKRARFNKVHGMSISDDEGRNESGTDDGFGTPTGGKSTLNIFNGQ